MKEKNGRDWWEGDDKKIEEVHFIFFITNKPFNINNLSVEENPKNFWSSKGDDLNGNKNIEMKANSL